MSRTFRAMRSGSVGWKLRIAMSASRRLRSLAWLEATISMMMPGCCARSFAMIGGSRIAACASLAAIETMPSIDCDWPAAESDTRLAASPMARTCSSSSSPLGVSVSPARPARTGRRRALPRAHRPAGRASAAPCPSARAAADSEPSSAVTRKARARFQSNFTDRQSMRKRISDGRIWSISLWIAAGVEPSLTPEANALRPLRRRALAEHPTEPRTDDPRPHANGRGGEQPSFGSKGDENDRRNSHRRLRPIRHAARRPAVAAKPDRRMVHSRMIGALFLAGFLVYGTGFALVTSVVGAPDFLATIADAPDHARARRAAHAADDRHRRVAGGRVLPDSRRARAARRRSPTSAPRSSRWSCSSSVSSACC